jgi:hypothetical protein
MTGFVTISFSGATLQTEVIISISSGDFALDPDQYLLFSGTFNFSLVQVLSGGITLTGNGGSATFSMQVPIIPEGTPIVTVNNFSGPASIVWTGGPAAQALTPGIGVSLANFSVG